LKKAARGVMKRTEITIEIDELILVRSRRGGPAQSRCPVCQAEVAMVTPEQAAAIAASTQPVVPETTSGAPVEFTYEAECSSREVVFKDGTRCSAR